MKKQIVIFVIDISMRDEKIEAINSVIKESILAIREISKNASGIKIKVAVLLYSFLSKWLTNEGPVSAEDESFIWDIPLSKASASDFGSACRALNEKLTGFIEQEDCFRRPVIIMINGKKPSDKWEASLETLNQNKWFNTAIKFTIAAGEDVNYDALKIFSGGMESVLLAFNPDILKETLKFLSVRSCQKAVADDSENKKIEEEIVREYTETIAAHSCDFTKCENGHIYTVNLDECPYCNGKTLDEALKEKAEEKMKFMLQLMAMCYAPPPSPRL